MYRFLSTLIMVFVLAASAAPVFAQSMNVTGLQWPPDTTVAETPFQCVDLYDPASVVIESGVSLPSTVPGVTQIFTGTIRNTANHPLLNGSLHIKIFKQETRTEGSVGAIDTLVEQQLVSENLTLRADGTVPFSYEWDVPLYAEGGEYYATFVFVTNAREQYAGLTFSDDSGAKSPTFTVVSDTQVAKFSKETVTINGAPYYFRSLATQLDARDITVSATLVNPTNQQKILPLQWNQYAWDASNKDNLRNTKTELITLAPNETRTVSYTPANQREAVVFITATTQERDAKSILNIRLLKQGVEEARLLTAGLKGFPLTAANEATLYACAHTTGVSSLDGVTVRIELADSSGNILKEYQADTTVRGVPAGFGETFTVPAQYDAVTLTAELLRGGMVIDRMVTTYDCAAIDPNTCASQAEDANWLSFLNKTMISIIGIFLLLGILVFLRLRHKGGHIVAMLMIAVSGVVFSPIVSEAKSVTWNQTPSGYAIQNFTPTTSFFDQANIDAGFNYSGYYEGIETPQITVTYEADVLNMSAGGVLLADGASIPLGTQLRFVPRAQEADAIRLTSPSYGAINGSWNIAITPPPISCNEDEYYSLLVYGGYGTGDTVGGSMGLGNFGSLYLPSSFRIPTVRIEHGGSAGLSCDASNQNCTVTSAGSVESRFIFESTNGQLYVREANYNRSFGNPPASSDQCRGDNEPVFLTPQRLQQDSNGLIYCYTNPDNPSTIADYRCSQRNIGGAYTVAVPEQQITYNFTVDGGVAPGQSCPNPAHEYPGASFSCADCSYVGVEKVFSYHRCDIGPCGPEPTPSTHAEAIAELEAVITADGADPANYSIGVAQTFADCPAPGCDAWFKDDYGNAYACPATVVPPVNAAPGTPTIVGPETGVTDTSYEFSFTATDPDGDQLQYGIDWNNDDVIDEWLPSISTYVNSGVTLPADYTWITTGTITFKALARDTNNLSSSWATHTIVITAAPIETADLKINNSDGPLTVNSGDALNLAWTGTNVPSCALYGAGLPGGTVAVTGNTSVSASISDTYTLVCGGVADQVAVTVINNAPPAATALLEAQVNGGAWSTADQTIDPGDTVALRWSSTDATSCNGTNFSTGGATSGNGSVTAPAPASATTFGLTCLSAGGNGTDSLTITTRALPNLNQPIITYSLSSGFDPATGIYDSVSVTFQTTNDGGSPATTPASYRVRFDRNSDGYDETKTGALGTFSVGQNVSRTEVFTSVPFSGNRVEVVVDSPDQVSESNEGDNERVLDMTIPPPDPNLEITVDRSPVRRGEIVTVSWDTNVTYPMNCSVFGPGVGPINFDPSVDGPTGSTPSQPINAKSEFTLRCIEPTTNTTFTTMAFAETVGEIEEI